VSAAADAYFAHRVRYLPRQIEDTRHKLRALMREARRYGMTELVNEVWDAVIIEAQAEAQMRGGSIGFGELRRGVHER